MIFFANKSQRNFDHWHTPLCHNTVVNMVYIAKALLILSFVLFANSAENGCQILKKIIDNCNENLECIAKGIELVGNDNNVHADKANAFIQPYVVDQTSFHDGVAAAAKCAEAFHVNHDNVTRYDIDEGLHCLLLSQEKFETAFGCKPLVDRPWQ